MSVGEVMVRVLGPVQLVGAGGEIVDLPSASQRRLLAALALHAPRPVPAAWLCGVLDVTPGALRTSVTRLRRVVGAGLLHTSVAGYRLNAVVDAMLACEEIESADGEPRALLAALRRWVGRPLDEFADEPWAVADAVRLSAVRAGAVEDLADALIASHRMEEAVALLVPYVVEHPYRDRPRGLTVRDSGPPRRPSSGPRAFDTGVTRVACSRTAERRAAAGVRHARPRRESSAQRRRPCRVAVG